MLASKFRDFSNLLCTVPVEYKYADNI